MRRVLTACTVALALTGLVRGQGTGPYLNFESPVHHSMIVADVGGTDLLLVCNTPDSSVEVYTASVTPQFLCRVPVGQEPVTVVMKPSPLDDAGTRRFYTANWLGDSLSSFDLTPTGSTPAVTCTAQRSMTIGDEPIGIAFLPTTPGEPWTQPGQAFHEALVVTFSAQAGWGIFDPNTLLDMGPLPGGGTLGHRELFDPAMDFAVKDPRALAFDPTATQIARLVIGNFRGGNSSIYDFDLWISDDLLTSVSTEASSRPAFGGLGSTNYDMVFRADGALYVCGQFARNNDFPAGVDPITALGEPHFQQMVLQKTGFVTSFLARVDGISGTPSVGQLLDLNLDSTGNQASVPVTQPTAIAIYDTGNPSTRRIFVTGFNTDTIGVVVDDPAQAPAMQVVDRLDVAPTNPPFSDTNPSAPMRGPRSLALLDDVGTGNDLLFVYNRFEHSITVIDAAYANPSQAVLGTVNLQYDPTPSYIRDGRKFLYGARMSGGGNVSCASCHVDGNTDFLSWNLSDGIPVAPEGQGLPDALGPNPGLKGPMFTQPLRGMVNFEHADDLAQDELYSNRPYHWRADRGFLEQFDGAFINLMGSSVGISSTDMTAFREMAFSIHYPPNPEQDWRRVYSGSMFNDPDNPDPADLADPTAGKGAARGLKLYHIQAQDGVACVTCHTLSDGSNNRLTEGRLIFSQLGAQSIETAQMKMLALKNKRLIRYNPYDSVFDFLGGGGQGAVTGEAGLTHPGFRAAGTPPSDDDTLSVHNFIKVNFPFTSAPDQEDLTRLSREFDTGTAPLVGFTASVTYDDYNNNPGGIQQSLTDFETQPNLANCGLAVHAWINGVLHGFYYEVSDPTTPYHEIPYGTVIPLGNFSQQGLLDFLDQNSGMSNPANVLTFHFTPLGSARRIAFLNPGPPPAMPTNAPTSVALEPCVPNTANVLVPLLDFNQYWLSVGGLGGFGPPTNGIDANPEIAKFTFQENLFFHATGTNPPGFGMNPVDETSRRFVVSGVGIQYGALLRIYAATAADIASGQPPVTTPVPGTNQIVVEAPVFARLLDSDGIVWETAVEVGPVVMAGLLNGGPQHAPVAAAWTDIWTSPALPLIPNQPGWNPQANIYDPMNHNWYWVEVENVPGDPTTITAGGWQRLTVQ